MGTVPCWGGSRTTSPILASFHSTCSLSSGWLVEITFILPPSPILLPSVLPLSLCLSLSLSVYFSLFPSPILSLPPSIYNACFLGSVMMQLQDLNPSELLAFGMNGLSWRVVFCGHYMLRKPKFSSLFFLSLGLVMYREVENFTSFKGTLIIQPYFHSLGSK